jgi:seryl-tRNA synthetase
MSANLAISPRENKPEKLAFTKEYCTQIILENAKLNKENTQHLREILKLEREARESRIEKINLQKELIELYKRLGDIPQSKASDEEIRLREKVQSLNMQVSSYQDKYLQAIGVKMSDNLSSQVLYVNK